MRRRARRRARQRQRSVVPAHGPGRGACWDSVRISALEIVALWEDRAELVAHALNRLPQLLQVDLDTELLQKGVVQHSQHSRLDLCTRLVVREGALRRRPQSEERAGEWQRLIIRNRHRERTLLENVTTTPSGAITLEFTAVGGRARADRIDVTLDAAAVELLIASATTEAGPRDQVNRTLYELLLPTQLKQDLFRFDNLQFIVDENTADFPWEALAAGAGRELGIRSGLLRQFQEFEGIRHDVRTPVGDHVLVIGDPPAAPLPSLPGASAEAKTVADVLGRDSFDVKGLIWNDNASIRDDFPNLRGNPGRRILNALFAEEWRVIHVASHGQFDADDSSRSGAVIDKDVFFTANVAAPVARCSGTRLPQLLSSGKAGRLACRSTKPEPTRSKRCSRAHAHRCARCRRGRLGGGRSARGRLRARTSTRSCWTAVSWVTPSTSLAGGSTTSTRTR